MYGCTPSELDNEDAYEVNEHMALKASEAEYNAAKAQADAAFAKVKGQRRGRK